mmetsp:Transcript_37680/g.117897  ORF Transcript_37680/g.117897 Transcript_37680/m.117897 type:complete len:532 (+) Transcript_37680:2095-3690(+)
MAWRNTSSSSSVMDRVESGARLGDASVVPMLIGGGTRYLGSELSDSWRCSGERPACMPGCCSGRAAAAAVSEPGSDRLVSVGLLPSSTTSGLMRVSPLFFWSPWLPPFVAVWRAALTAAARSGGSPVRLASERVASIFARLPPSALRSANHFLRADEFQRFFTMFSVRPGRSLAISHQRLPKICCASKMMVSSSSVHGALEMLGSRWLNHRSRHCLPMRPGRSAAMSDHFTFPTPWRMTMSRTTSSSAACHGPLCSPGLSTLFQRCRHCTSERVWPRSSAIFFQFFAPCSCTMPLSRASSSLDHLPPCEGLRGFRRTPFFVFASCERSCRMRFCHCVSFMPAGRWGSPGCSWKTASAPTEVVPDAEPSFELVECEGRRELRMAALNGSRGLGDVPRRLGDPTRGLGDAPSAVKGPMVCMCSSSMGKPVLGCRSCWGLTDGWLPGGLMEGWLPGLGDGWREPGRLPPWLPPPSTFRNAFCFDERLAATAACCCCCCWKFDRLMRCVMPYARAVAGDTRESNLRVVSVVYGQG